MKNSILLITSVVLLSSCSKDNNNDEVPCTCDEVISQDVVIQGQPAPTYELEVDFCDINGTSTVQVSQQEYNSTNVGDCYQ